MNEKPVKFGTLLFELFEIVKKEEEKCGRVGYQNYLSYTLQRNINNLIIIYMKLVCAVIKLESLIMAQNVRWRHA